MHGWRTGKPWRWGRGVHICSCVCAHVWIINQKAIIVSSIDEEFSRSETSPCTCDLDLKSSKVTKLSLFLRYHHFPQFITISPSNQPQFPKALQAKSYLVPGKLAYLIYWARLFTPWSRYQFAPISIVSNSSFQNALTLYLSLIEVCGGSKKKKNLRVSDLLCLSLNDECCWFIIYIRVLFKMMIDNEALWGGGTLGVIFKET